MNNIAIQLKNITKKYIVHHEKPTLVETIVKTKNEEFFALKNIDLVIRKGEKIGIIGPNGSGKTTLLKIIAGITTPTTGYVDTQGKVVSLIDIEAGFHPDLTGEQNIYLNGMLLGLKRSDIQKKLPTIIRFAGIGKFIDAPLYTYSDGMKLRLGFSIAIHAQPDTLLLDEAIIIGDQFFLKKSQAKIEEYFQKEKTILVVSHWVEFLYKNCQKLIILEHGKITYCGPIQEGLKKYTNLLKTTKFHRLSISD